MGSREPGEPAPARTSHSWVFVFVAVNIGDGVTWSVVHLAQNLPSETFLCVAAWSLEVLTLSGTLLAYKAA